MHCSQCFSGYITLNILQSYLPDRYNGKQLYFINTLEYMLPKYVIV